MSGTSSDTAEEGEVAKDSRNTQPHHDESVPYYLRPKAPIVGRASTESQLVAATGRPVSHSDIIAAVGTLGGTPFRVHSRYHEINLNGLAPSTAIITVYSDHTAYTIYPPFFRI